MKKQLFFIAGLLLLNSTIFGQSEAPKFVLKGSNVSLTKGTIDTETLSEIIQVKQEEVRQRVFKNLIVSHFWKNNNDNYQDSTNFFGCKKTRIEFNAKLDNFATQFFVYNLMNDVIEGKNKKAITKNMVATAAEFSEIYAFALYYASLKDGVLQKEYLEKNTKLINEANKASETIYSNEVKNNSRYIKNTIYVDNILTSSEVHFSTFINSTQDVGRAQSDVRVNFSLAKRVIPFANVLIDNCFEVLLDSSTTFKKYKNDASFKTWFDANSYSKRNTLIKDTNLKDDFRKKYTEFIGLKADLKVKYDSVGKYLTKIQKDFKAYKNMPDSVKTKLNDFAKALTEVYKQTNLPAKFSPEKTFEYVNVALEIMPLLEPVVRNSAQEVDVITKNQYDAIKIVLGKFAKLMKGHSKNDIIPQLTTIFIDNFQFEVDKDEKDKNGIAYVDIEALISQLFEDFQDRYSSRLRLFVKPILEIGTNTFFAVQDGKGFFDKTKNSYFNNPASPFMLASEKIGAKFMIYNTKQARIYKPGEVYKDRWGYSKTWLKPTKEPLIDDVSITGYASGILYNVANIRTEKNFNQPFLGVGLSFKFFNGLSLSANYAKTFKAIDALNLKQEFVGLNLDIPIVEYITAVRKKRK